MSHNRSPRPVRSFVANLFDFARHRLRQSSPSYPLSGFNNADSPTAGAISTPGIDPASIRRQVSSPGTPHQTTSSTQGASPSKAMGQGPFYQAHDFVMNNPVFVDNSSDNFMASFLKETIIGAEFDSSDPNMPLRCHPGTRLGIIKRCQDFILSRGGRSKLRWVVGAAGVGKSAIMQSVARDEFSVLSDIIIGATVFLSVNGRQDGTKTVTTIAYQLAVKLNPYRRFVQREITHDPSLLRKSLSTQFENFIVKPFIHQHILNPSSRLLIIIDGLDECAQTSMQRELLGLISDLCITYPTSPIVWMIASRPEPHITSFFSQPKLALSYEKEEILVDSDDALGDVKRYLRDKFQEIQMASITLQHLPQWPSEDDFSKIAKASGGLFAYASTVIRYISDPAYGDPISQLDDVLEIIKTGISRNVSGEDHPMAQLDALYARILSRIPDKVMVNTRKLLLLYVGRTRRTDRASFHLTCNILGMTENAAYGATHHIHSIAFVPRPSEAANEAEFRIFHKSFYDYLRDFQRSGFSPDFTSEAKQLMDECVLRILEQAPDGVYMDGASRRDLEFGSGFLTNGPGTGDNISISWPAVGEDKNPKLRLHMFRYAMTVVVMGLANNEGVFCRSPCLRVLTTCFAIFPINHALAVSVFDESLRRELLDHGILKHVPLEKLHYDHLRKHVLLRLRYRSPTVGLPDRWNTSCQHKREGSWDNDSQDWSTNWRVTAPCNYCSGRFTRHSEMQLPGHLVTIFNLDLTTCVVELRFVDPDDGVSEWTYHLLAKYKVGGEEV